MLPSLGSTALSGAQDAEPAREGPPEAAWPEIEARAPACYTAPSREVARLLRDDRVSRYERELPTAVACFLDDFEAWIAQLRFPLTHRSAIRTTNLLERWFGEERPVHRLMDASLIRDSERRRGLRVVPFEAKQLDALRAELYDTHRRRVASATTRSDEVTPSRVSSKTGARPC